MRATGANFNRVAKVSGIEVLRTPFRAPRANAFCERFLGSVRRECLDHMLVLSEKHMHRVIKEFVEYYNQARPHQGISQAVPDQQAIQAAKPDTAPPETRGKVISLPVRGGLHHNYKRVA